MKHALIFIAALMVLPAPASAGDDQAEFVRGVEQCAGSAPVASSKYRRCLEDAAWSLAHARYDVEAHKWFFADFEDEHPDGLNVIASAKHWKDFRGVGQESLDYQFKLMRPLSSHASLTLVARLKRIRGGMISAQVGNFLNEKFALRQKLEPFLSLPAPSFFVELQKIVGPLDTSIFAVDELETDDQTCPALKEVNLLLGAVIWPLPYGKPSESAGPDASGVDRISVVIHPHVVVLHVNDYPISWTIQDASMDTDVYRWVTQSAKALEPCWRPRK